MDNIRISGSVTLTVHLGLGRTYSRPVSTTDEAEEIVRKMAIRDPGFPLVSGLKTEPITYTVKYEEYFNLYRREDDDELPF